MKTIVLSFTLTLFIFSFLPINAQPWAWANMQKVITSDRDFEDGFGAAVAINGNYAIVGAFLEDENSAGNDSIYKAGSAYIFEKGQNGSWKEIQKIVASDRHFYDGFGSSVAISGNYAIVGAWRKEKYVASDSAESVGAAYVFERGSDGIWSEVKKLTASDGGADDRFGVAVAISGNHAIIGAIREDENPAGTSIINDAGSAYVFERGNDGVWQEVQKIMSSDRSLGDEFGQTISMDQNYAIIGAPRENNDKFRQSGSVYLFKKTSNGVWIEHQKLVALDKQDGDTFGRTISISGSYIIVGSWASDDSSGNNAMMGAGSAYIFERGNNDNWRQVQKITASDRNWGSNFGYAVAISKEYALVGAEDGSSFGGKKAGSVYQFERDDYGTWNEVEKISAFDAEAKDQFGSAISISESQIIVGSWKEDHNLFGTDSLESAGSAYILNLNIDGQEQIPLSVYPNPVTETLTIDLTPLDHSKVTIEIYDSQGRKVFSKVGDYQSQSKLDITTLSSGPYFISIIGGTEQFYAKFIKQ